ncbi:MAG: DUF357 domain-containing protein [archaeon]|mgnify:FL=1
MTKEEGRDWKVELETRVNRYRNVTQSALQKVEIAAPPNTKEHTIAMDYLTMANNYFNDALHFQEQGELTLALAAFSYAHAWMDAGVRAGILNGKEDDRLFTLP